MNLPTRNQAIKIIKILFPQYSHYDWHNFKNEIYIGEYGSDGWKHTDSLCTIEFQSPTFSECTKMIRFWNSGIQIWETDKKTGVSTIEANTHQFDLYKYLKKDNIL